MLPQILEILIITIVVGSSLHFLEEKIKEQ